VDKKTSHEELRCPPRIMTDTLTWDRVTEMAAHKWFTTAIDVAVYFYDPQSLWQRATSDSD
jgi:IS30 family transposase